MYVGGIYMFSYLAQYTTFQTVKEMDRHVRKHLIEHELTNSEEKVLLIIAQHALAYPGVTHLKAETIAEKGEISTKTVFRATKKLQELGIIRKQSTTKLNGIQGAMIYIILPNVRAELSYRPVQKNPHHESTCRPIQKEQPLSFKSKSSSNIYNNMWHQFLIELFESIPFQNEPKQQMLKAVYSIPITNQTQFHRAKRIIFELLKRIQFGTLKVNTSYEALLKGAYEKWTFQVEPINNGQAPTRTVPFYNWLEEREDITIHSGA